MKFIHIDFNSLTHHMLEEFVAELDRNYADSFGAKYHRKRISENSCAIVVGLAQPSGVTCAGCYIKPSGRRCATFVNQEYRGMGLAEELIEFSLIRMPMQYSILSKNRGNMIEALRGAGFSIVKTRDNVRTIAGDEGDQLDFQSFRKPTYHFSRFSKRRQVVTKNLIMMQKGFIDD